MNQEAIIPKPESPKVELSEYFNQYPWLRTAGQAVKYTAKTYKTKRTCMECQATKHEAHGQTPPYRSVRHVRTIQKKIRGKVETLTLELCSAHALLWKDRDNVA